MIIVEQFCGMKKIFDATWRSFHHKWHNGVPKMVEDVERSISRYDRRKPGHARFAFGNSVTITELTNSFDTGGWCDRWTAFGLVTGYPRGC